MSRQIHKKNALSEKLGKVAPGRNALCILAFLCAAGCARASEAPPPTSQSPTVGAAAAAVAPADVQTAASAAVSRKIVRQAELELEVPSPSTAQTAIERMAERHGGYVVSAARDTDHETAVDIRVTLVVRVPQAELTATLGELKRLGRGIGSERITSDDVTDEYIDLGARIQSQQGLEQQYLEILKRAATVKDAMDVQKQLADVRAEIERLQGRAHLLDKESAFSTLTVHLSTAVPQIAVSRTTFGGTLSRAWADAVSLSVELICDAIHLFAMLIPIALLIGLPSALGLWVLTRTVRALSARSRRQKLANAASAAA